MRVATAADQAEPARSVREELLRTLRTGKSESVSSHEGSKDDFRTLRTPFSKSRAHVSNGSDHAHMYKDWETGVLSVLDAGASPAGVGNRGPKRPRAIADSRSTWIW